MISLKQKKSIGPIISITLLLLVSIVSMVFLSSWYSSFQSDYNSKVSVPQTQVEVKGLVDNFLYVRSYAPRNISYKAIQVGGVDCSNSGTLISNDYNKINISGCTKLVSNGVQDIMIVSDVGVFEKNLIIKNTYLGCSLNGTTLEHGQSFNFANSSIVPIGNTCSFVNRICSDGTLSSDSSFNISSCSVINPNFFTSIWNTSLTSPGSSGNNQIHLPLESVGTYNFNINWGDGTSDTILTWNQAQTTHTYATQGIYTLNISGTIKGFRFNNAGDKLKLLDITKWGVLNVGNGGSYFYGATNLVGSATDILNLTETTDLHSMFRNAISFNQSLNSWDVSNVTDLHYMFAYASSFNQPLNSWNVSKITDLHAMFRGASSFNQPLNNWNTSSAINLSYMFRDAISFNQSLNNWNTSSVASISNMFYGASSFNQPLNNWNTSSVTTMDRVFKLTNFNQPLNNWDTSSVNTMSNLFFNANNFNQPLNNWNTSSVNTMSHMFYNTNNFNQSLNNWDTSSVNNWTYCSSGAISWTLPHQGGSIPGVNGC